MVLIIAIILILILATSVGIDKQKANEVDHKISQNKENNEILRRIACDKDFELLCKERIECQQNHNDIMVDLKQIFNNVPSCVDMGDLQFLPKNKHQIEYSMVLRLLLAKEGKIPSDECWADQFLHRMYLPGQTTAERRLMRKRFKDLMGWVEQELQRQGVPVRLIVVVGPNEGDPDWKNKVSRGVEFYWSDYKKFTDPEALTDNIYGFRWSLT